MTTEPEQTIVDYIKDFMNTSARTGTMRAWLHFDLIDMMEIYAYYYQSQTNNFIKNWSSSENDPQMAALRVENGSLDASFEKLRERYTSAEYRQRLDDLHFQKGEYHQFKDRIVFLRDEFFPALKQLQEGDIPSPRHLQILSIAAMGDQNNEYGASIPSVGEICSFANEFDIPLDSSPNNYKGQRAGPSYKISDERCKSIGEFCETLHDKVKQAVETRQQALKDKQNRGGRND